MPQCGIFLRDATPHHNTYTNTLDILDWQHCNCQTPARFLLWDSCHNVAYFFGMQPRIIKPTPTHLTYLTYNIATAKPQQGSFFEIYATMWHISLGCNPTWLNLHQHTWHTWLTTLQLPNPARFLLWDLCHNVAYFLGMQPHIMRPTPTHLPYLTENIATAKPQQGSFFEIYATMWHIS